MKIARTAGLILLLIGAFASSPFYPRARAQNKARPVKRYPLPPHATQCDVLLPIQIEFVPLNNPEVGRPAKFQVQIESSLDPDVVKSTWVEYEIPQRLRRIASSTGRGLPAKTGRSLLDVEVNVPDPSPYAIRARIVVQLIDGRTISRTATHWINVGAGDTPEGVVRRLVDPDGSGILVYQGVTVRH